MNKGLNVAPRFDRLIIPTINKSYFGKIKAAFTKPRIKMYRNFYIPLPEGKYVIIPKGFESDGGSVPVFGLWALVALAHLTTNLYVVGASLIILLIGLSLNAFGLMLSPFLVHDFALKHKCLILSDKTLLPINSVWEANRYMRRINFATNDMILLGTFAHMAVTLGAWKAWYKHRKNDNTETNSIERWGKLYINEATNNNG